MSTFTRVFFVALLFVAVANAFTAAPLKSSRVIGACYTMCLGKRQPARSPVPKRPGQASLNSVSGARSLVDRGMSGGPSAEAGSDASSIPSFYTDRMRRTYAVLTRAPAAPTPPAARSVTASAQPQMAFEAASSHIATVTNALLASKETDFGGYAGPAVALVVLGILITVLTNPVRAEPRVAHLRLVWRCRRDRRMRATYSRSIARADHRNRTTHVRPRATPSVATRCSMTTSARRHSRAPHIQPRRPTSG